MLNTPAARLIANGAERTLLLEDVEALQASKALVVDACRYVVRDRAARWCRSQAVRCCSNSHARWAKRGPETFRGMSCLRAHSERNSRTNRTARGCVSKSGGCAECFGHSPASSATKSGFLLAPCRAREVVVLARPVEDEHGAVLAFLTDGESWSSSALALALGTSQRTVQRALDSLAAAGRVQAFGRARARRWMTPPVPGFTTTLLLPAPLPSD